MMTILILSRETDLHAIHLLARCRKRGIDALLFNPRTFSEETLIATFEEDWRSTLTIKGRTLDLAEIGGIWYRRPDPPEVHHDLLGQARTFALAESRHALGGILHCAPSACWINPLEAVTHAEYKPVQLALAKQCGLQTAPTLISNDPDAVRSFVAQHSRVIYKTLSGPRIRAEEGSQQDTLMIYTSECSEAHLKSRLETISYAPCLFQVLVEKAYELRITIVDEQVFPVAIYSQQTKNGTIDFRRDYEQLTYEVMSLPEFIKEQLLLLVRRLGLVYAAIDMVVTPEGQYVFLELNPQGQYLWLEFTTQAAITDALIDYLVTGEPK